MTTIDKIRRFLDRGRSAKEIAKKLDVTPTYVNYVKRKAATESRKEVLKRTLPKQFTKSEIAALGKDQFLHMTDQEAQTALNKLDLVNHPPHYKAGGIETIDFIEAKDLNFRLGNVIKYVARAEKKGDPLEDLKKAKWYLEREIAVRERA